MFWMHRKGPAQRKEHPVYQQSPLCPLLSSPRQGTQEQVVSSCCSQQQEDGLLKFFSTN